MASLRAASAADTPDILRLIRALADYERLPHEVVATESALRETLFGPQPAAEVLLAVAEGRAVGMALYFPTYSTFLARRGIHLEDLFVEPEHRGRGLGEALLRAVARRAVEQGCGRLEWSVLDWNEPAIRFYRKLGAAPMDQWTVMRVAGDALARLARPAPPAQEP